MTATAISFDDVRHVYSVDGRPLLHVTDVLAGAGLIDTFWYRDADAIRGTHVHAMIRALNDGAPVPVPDDLRGYVEAWIAFRTQSGFHVAAGEEIVADLALRCAGTLDLRGSFDPSLRTRIDIIDIKTGTLPAWVGYQTAGYARLLSAAPHTIHRWALQLRDDGRYLLVPQINRRDDSVFLAALTIAQAKRGWL